MRSLIAFFIRQRLFSDLLTVAVIGLGIMAALLIRREVFPNVNFDVITVRTLFPGSSPDETERLITNLIEQDLQEVDGIKRQTSVSLEGMSNVVIYLDPDQTNSVEGKSDIQDVVDRLKSEFPAEAEEPQITALESKQGPIIEVSIAGDIPPIELRAVAKRLERIIESVPGVARVALRGLRDMEIRVEANQAALSRYRLSLNDVANALRGQNISVPGGTIEVSSKDLAAKERLVRTVGEFKTPADVGATVVRANELGRPILVRDVARVFFDLEKASVETRTNGKPSLNLTVLKKEKADAIDLVDSVKAKIAETRDQLDPRIDLTYINDFSEFIRRRLKILTSNLVVGLGLVMLVLPLLLPLRFALLVALGLPFAFLGATLLLYYTGNTINLISMMGLIIVTGILVDDAIIVTENTVRALEETDDPEEAAIQGTRQIVGPMTASVLTTVLAFLPMAFMSGIFGKFIQQIPIAVIAALGISLFEAVFILPSHLAHWVAPGLIKERLGLAKKRNLGRLGAFLERSRGFWELKVTPGYIRILRRFLQHRYWVAGILLIFFLGTLGLAAKGMRFVLFPPEGVEIFFVRTEAEIGTSITQHTRLLRGIEQRIAQLPEGEVGNYTTTIGIVQQDPNDPNTLRGSEYAQIAVYLTPENHRERNAATIIDEVRKSVVKPEGIKKITFARVNPGPPTGKPVSLGVRGSEYEKLMPVVEELKEILGKMTGVTDISDSYVLGKQELRIKVNPTEAAAANLSVASIGTAVRASFEGLVPTTVRELEEEIDVRVSLPESERQKSSSLERILIANPAGNLIPLSRVSTIVQTQGLAVFEHEDNQRQIKVTADVNTDKTSAIEVNNAIRNRLPELQKKYPGIGIDFGGEDEDTQESLASLARAFVLALISIFLILVLTFRNLLQPMVVLLTVPLGVISVIWAFFLHGMPMSFMGMLGIVALGGVIVNNAIVLVDFVNAARAQGMDRFESIVESARIRIRPIFLTSITTVVGLLPTAYGIGGLDKFVVPIAMALGWGILFGSLMTAFIFPSALAILDDISALGGRIKARLVSS